MFCALQAHGYTTLKGAQQSPRRSIAKTNAALALINRHEADLLAIFKTRAEFDLRDRATPEVFNNSSKCSTGWCWGGTSYRRCGG